MKILIIYQYFGTPRGSWSTRIYELSRRWVQSGNSVTVVTAPYEKSDIRAKHFLEQQTVEGILLRIINLADDNRHSILKRSFRAFLFSFFSTGYALTQRYDVIICSSGPITVGIPGILARWFRKKKFIFEIRDLWPAGGIEMKKITSAWQIYVALWFEKLCYRNAQAVVTASPDQEKHIRHRFPDIRTVVISNACDNDIFGETQLLMRPSWAIGKKIFSHIGSLGFIHNVGLLLDAARELKKENASGIEIVLIGEGAERKALERRVTEEKLDNVRFLGLLPKNELPAWVQASVATLFTTLNNPVQNSSSPNKVFDSFAAGTPVIQTTTGWLHELFEKEKCGINVPPDNPKAMAEAMLKMATDDQLRTELSSNARRIAHTQFDRAMLANQYLQLLQSVNGG